MPTRDSVRRSAHRRKDEIAFLRERLQALEIAISTQMTLAAATHTGVNWRDIYEYERQLADELLHARHSEPLGETLQRRLMMAERWSRELAQSAANLPGQQAGGVAYWAAEKARLALSETLQHWWAWLAEPIED